LNVLTRALKAAWDEANKPVGYVKGDEFELYVRTTLFPRDCYELLSKTHDYADNKGDYIASSKMPDFEFKAKNNGIVFFVEAKYRSKYQDQVLEWCKSYQLKRYQEINNVTPVLIAIGLGGQPAAPEGLCLIPMKHIKFTKLYPSFLERYEIHRGQPISENYVKRVI
jgi:hypothetical protein